MQSPSSAWPSSLRRRICLSARSCGEFDLSGAAGMEVVSSISEFKPGEELPRHLHHGVEAGYVVQGAMVQNPGQQPAMLATGAPILNLREVVHGGFKVVGPGNLILFTVHTVDKGEPLYDWAK